jgi:cytochrome c553
MAADGNDIRMLSAHENNEWQPSITHDGKIIYTRWDYVDRHGCTAHAPWITTPDGRDTRPVHGNYAIKSKRPDMEMDVRAIPDSHRFIATAAPHHGQAFGSLVMVDPRVKDDDAMAPVKRITPEVEFPESETKGRAKSKAYGTAWPLSEHYYICVYDDTDGWHHGIYLVDAFGNKELLYRDPEIASLSPIPFRPRKAPRAIPSASTRLAENADNDVGIMGVVNVYDSLKPWPANTTIKALRILQMLPSTVPSGSPPHEIGIRIKSAPDSVTMARQILGTVPVEEDGSAFFKVPAMRELSFQALDENGLAIQGMRSAAYVQPGEVLVCQGCHEKKTTTPQVTHQSALAFQRPPSEIKPDVNGTKPFSYPILVQPVLDNNCVACHAENQETAPPLDRTVIKNGNKIWYQSYWSLAPEFGFHDYGDNYRTTPGAFGARASKLFNLLQSDHYNVKLSNEELRRITLWLDSSSVFYGVYEKEGGEAQLQGKEVSPTLE